MLKDKQDISVESEAAVGSGPSDQPIEFGNSEYGRINEITEALKAEEDKKKKEQLEEELEKLKKKAADRAQQYDQSLKHFLLMMAQLGGQTPPGGCKDAMLCQMFDTLNQNDEFMSRLKNEGRELAINSQTGEIQLEYKTGGRLRIIPSEGGGLCIQLKGLKMDETVAHDIISIHKARNPGPLTISGRKKNAQLLWRTAKIHGLATADATDGAYKPSKDDMHWLQQVQAEQLRAQQANEQFNELESNGLLPVLSTLENGYQDALNGQDEKQIMLADDGSELAESKHMISAYGRLKNAMGFEPQIGGAVEFTKTNLDDKQIKEIEDLLQDGVTTEKLEKAIKIANPKDMPLKSLREDQLSGEIEMEKQQMRQVAAMGESRFGRFQLRRAGIKKDQLTEIKEAVEDSRFDEPVSRFQIKPEVAKPETPAEKAGKKAATKSRIAAGDTDKWKETDKHEPKPPTKKPENDGPKKSKPSAPTPPGPKMGGGKKG